MKTCWLCGRNGAADPLDEHHIFGGPNRKLSDRFGLTVYLCHHDCHIFGEKAVHRDPETAQLLHEYGQRKAMEEQGWTRDEFRMIFGKNYLDEERCQDPSTPLRSAQDDTGEALRFAQDDTGEALRSAQDDSGEARDVEDAVPYDGGIWNGGRIISAPTMGEQGLRADGIRPYVSTFQVLDVAVPF